jgi:hypothetical protein
MSAEAPRIPPHRSQAVVSWRELRSETLLLSAGVLAMAVSFAADAVRHQHEYFARSGAIAVFLSGLVAFRSLNKHYRKFLNYSDLSQVPKTSRNQRIIDWLTLWLSIIATLVWAYGDLVFKRVWS